MVLVDIEYDDIDEVSRIIDENDKVTRIDRGIYITHLNFYNRITTPNIEFPTILDDGDIIENIHELPLKERFAAITRSIPDYGVCDEPGQVMEKFGRVLQESRYRFAVFMTKITKDRYPGWRWHKWGEYIGDKEPHCEYLRDEDDSIKHVYCYNIIVITL